jgi:hypothetical protein
MGKHRSENNGKPTISKSTSSKSNKKFAISGHIRRNIHFLQRIAACRTIRHHNRLRQILSASGPEQLLCLVECCLNLLRGRIPKPKQRLLNRLRSQAPQLRAFCKARSARTAREHLQQEGGGLPALIPLVISAVLPVIVEKVIDKISNSQ